MRINYDLYSCCRTSGVTRASDSRAGLVMRECRLHCLKFHLPPAPVGPWSLHKHAELKELCTFAHTATPTMGDRKDAQHNSHSCCLGATALGVPLLCCGTHRIHEAACVYPCIPPGQASRPLQAMHSAVRSTTMKEVLQDYSWCVLASCKLQVPFSAVPVLVRPQASTDPGAT